MSRNTAIIILVVVVLIFLLYRIYGVKGAYENIKLRGLYYRDKFIVPAKTLYEQTIGHVNDETSKLAIQKAENQNINFIKHETNGGLLDAEINEAINIPFILGDLYNYNAGNHDRAIEMYTTTLDRLDMHHNQINPGVVPVETILDRTEQIPELTPRSTSIRKKIAVSYKLPMVKVTSDPQNVHDSVVNKKTSTTYSKIRDLNLTSEHQHVSDFEATNNELKTLIAKKIKNEDPVKRAELISIYNNLISQIVVSNAKYNTFNDTESNIYKNVVTRIKSPENRDSRDELMNALADSIKNMVQESRDGTYHTVCLGGRMNNLMNTFTLLDADPGIANPIKTSSILKSEIFSKMQKELELEIAKQDPGVRDHYNDINKPTPPGYEETINKIRENIKNKLETQYINTPESDTANKYISEGLIAID